MSKVKLIGTLNRDRGYFTPSESEILCPYFKRRFFEWGVSAERRAVCELQQSGVICDYRHITADETPICLRYEHGPDHYDIIPDVTDPPTDLKPIPYLEATKDAENEYTKDQWFTTKFVDTHEKTFRLRDGKMEWFYNV